MLNDTIEIILPLKSMTSGIFVSWYVLSTRTAEFDGITVVEMEGLVVWSHG